MTPQWSLEDNKLTGLAMAIIADGKAPGPERDGLVNDFITRIASDRRFKSYNAVRLYFNIGEIDTTTIFDHAMKFGMTVVADSIDTEFKLRPKTYAQYIDKLYKKGIRIFCVDDVHRYTEEQVKLMRTPIYNKRRDTYLILSAGVAKASTYIEMGATLSREKSYSGAELQLYRSGESTIWVDRWMKANPNMTVAALEVYKPDDRPMTTITELKTMAQYILNGKPANISAYAFYDENTDLRNLPDHWDETLRFAHLWHKSRGN